MYHIPLLEIYEQLKFWLPVSTFLALVYKAYTKAKDGVSMWAETLLDNHMAHIQGASERASDAVVSLASYHKDMLESQKDLVKTLSSVKEDFHEYSRENARTQAAIATGIEVIKSKLDTSLVAQVRLTNDKSHAEGA
jgi:hypothetical protein